MTFEPLGDRILVKRMESETKYGSIILPDRSVEKPQLATVIATGAGHYEGAALIPSIVKPGEKIMFGKYSGTEIKLDGIDYTIMREADVLGIVHGE